MRSTGILLIWACILIIDIDGKEFYCTQSDTWIDTINACVAAGGEAVTFNKLLNNTELRLAPNLTLWTGDYINVELVASVPENNDINYECGYRTLQRDPNDKDVHFPQQLRYTRCSENKHYFCRSDSSYNLYGGRSTWIGANQECKKYDSFKLWSGIRFRSTNKDYDGVDSWVLAARRYSLNAVKSDVNSSAATIVVCGTNIKEISRDDANICEEALQAVCSFEPEQETTTESNKDFTTSNNVENSQPVTGYKTTQHSNATEKLSNDNDRQSDIIIIVTSISVVICCLVAGLIIIVFCQRRRKNQFRKQAMREDSIQTASTIDKSGLHNNTYSNEARHRSEADNEYYNVIHNNATHQESPNDTYTVSDDGPDYGDVYSVPNKIKAPSSHKINQNLQESEYDTTNAIQTLNESTNIYNKLGFNHDESVYDNNEDSGVMKPPQSVDNTYATTCVQDVDTYNTLNTDWNRGEHNHSSNQTNNVYGNANTSLASKDNVYFNGNMVEILQLK